MVREPEPPTISPQTVHFLAAAERYRYSVVVVDSLVSKLVLGG